MAPSKSTPVEEGAACENAKRDIQGCGVPPTQHIDKRFFPREALARILTEPRVRQILNCSCGRCAKHVALLGKQGQPGDYIKRILGFSHTVSEPYAGALALLALLIYIEHPLFIVCFVEGNYNDANALGNYTGPSAFNPLILEDIWSNYKDKDSDGSKLLAYTFAARMYQFSVPRMDDGKFSKYNENVILPFIGEEELGSGSYGEVFSFYVHEEYRKFPLHKDVRKFARKELFGNMDSTPVQFALERENLDRVDLLRDPHIVQIVKSYRKGKSFNIVFPCAKANLHEALRTDKYGLKDLCRGPLVRFPIWNQLRGLANALDRILNYSINDDVGGLQVPSSGAHRLFGYHFDLKPANILVEVVNGQMVFKISDFGQAKFKDMQAGTSKVSQRDAGTHTYAPPEEETQQQNSKYDVWSLGCIFLETITFAVKGHVGVRELDRTRKTRIDRNSSDNCYWETNNKQARLKTSVVKWLDTLYVPGSESAIEIQFLAKLRKLTLSMLQVDTRERKSSTEVYHTLNGLLEEVKASMSVSPTLLPMIAAEGELEIASHIFLSIRYEAEHRPAFFATPRPVRLTRLSLRKAIRKTDVSLPLSLLARSKVNQIKDFLPTQFQLFESNTGHLRIVTTVNSQRFVAPIRRDAVKLIPQYAMRRTEHKTRDYWDVRLVLLDNPHQQVDGFEYVCSTPKEIEKFHSALMGQEILGSFQLEDVVLEKHVPVLQSTGKKLKQSYRSVKHIWRQGNEHPLTFVDPSAAETSDEKGPFTLQLWCESKNAPPDQFPRNNSFPPKPTTTDSIRRPRERQPTAEAALCRFVIYFNQGIVLIPFQDFQKDRNESRRHVLKIVPGNPSVNRYVFASTLQREFAGEDNLLLPGLPLDKSKLRAVEHRHTEQYLSFSLVFADSEGAQNFEARFREERSRWHNESKKLQGSQEMIEYTKLQ